MEKRLDKNFKKFSSRMQARLLLVFCVITILLIGLIGRLIYIMQTDGERYAKQVLSRQSYVSAVLPYKRGDIMDRNGTVLARSELQYRLFIDPKKMILNSEYIPQTLEALKSNFGIEPDTVNQVLKDKPQSQYYVLLKNLKHDQVSAFKELMKENTDIKAVYFEEEYIRTYPFKTLASDIIGFTSADNTGYWGLEEYYNDELNGTNGREYGYYDSTLNIERIVKKPENGYSIVSTIDANIQRIIQNHIRKFNEEIGSKNIGILIMNPNNGEIIAMASNEEYDLNKPRSLDGIYTEEEQAALTQDQKMEALNKLWRNDIISNGFEPGSTFKPVTIAAALEEALASDNSTYFCDGGEHVGGFYIKCSSYKRGGHGLITLGEALVYSCNDALMQIAAAEGRDMFYDYQTSFGFGRKTGVDLPGEASGIIVSRDKLNATELATSSFGQTFNVTMLQMAAAYSSVVNGGYYYQPHVVKQIINDQGATIKLFDKMLVRQTVSEKTSEFIQKYMYQTVELGTAKHAKVEGYAVGGKTGTAQKYPRDAKTYVVSFLGAVPAINPEMVIYVTIDEPQNVVRQDDSSLATKLASQVLKEILPALGIFPEGDIDYLLPQEGEDSENGNTDSNTGGVTPSGNEGAAGNTQGTAPGNAGEGSPNAQNGSNQDNTIENGGSGTGSPNHDGQDNTAPDQPNNGNGNTSNSGNREGPVGQATEGDVDLDNPGIGEETGVSGDGGEDEYSWDSIPPDLEGGSSGETEGQSQ